MTTKNFFTYKSIFGSTIESWVDTKDKTLYGLDYSIFKVADQVTCGFHFNSKVVTCKDTIIFINGKPLVETSFYSRPYEIFPNFETKQLKAINYFKETYYIDVDFLL